MHGYGEHKEIVAYRLLGEAVTAAGIELHGFDLPGHGRERELPSDWQVMREDLGAVAAAVGPDAIVGLSLGAIVTLDWAIHSETKTPLVTIGAPLGPVRVSPVIRLIGKLLTLVAPQANLSPRLGVEKVSRNEALVKEYLADPLFHQRATGPAFDAFFRAVKQVRQNAARIQAPLLMLHGEQDNIATPHREFGSQTSSPCAKEKLYPGARHNLLLETNREEVYADLIRFVLPG